MDDISCYRCRLFYLRPSDDPALQAEAACEVLTGTEGVLLAAPATKHSIHLIYSLNHLSFELLTELLTELGFEFDTSILLGLRNTVFQFLEDNALDHMHQDVPDLEIPCESTTQVPHQSPDKYWEDYH